jgi:hypothetical protein
MKGDRSRYGYQLLSRMVRGRREGAGSNGWAGVVVVVVVGWEFPACACVCLCMHVIMTFDTGDVETEKRVGPPREAVPS